MKTDNGIWKTLYIIGGVLIFQVIITIITVLVKN